MKTDSLQLNDEKIIAIENFLAALNRLNELGILNNRKDFTSQLGEWLIAEMYGATLADSGKQKDWDMLLVDGKKIQVKTHSKAKTTNRKNTDFNYTEDAQIDIFIIVVFNENYKIKNIYEIPFKEAFKLINNDKKYKVINWNKIPLEYNVSLEEKIGENKLLKSFLEVSSE